MPSGNVWNEMLNFCLMTYLSGFYSFSLLFFLVQIVFYFLRNPMIFPLELLHIYCGNSNGKWLIYETII